jgi:hypothetical protein
MFHKLTLALALVLVPALVPTLGFSFKRERDYQRQWAQENGGVVEVRLGDGSRVDVVTSEYAVEIEYARKWAEAVGQSLFYAQVTGKKAVIVLITGSGDTGLVNRLKQVIAYHKLPILVQELKK